MPRAPRHGCGDPADDDALWHREIRDARPLKNRASPAASARRAEIAARVAQPAPPTAPPMRTAPPGGVDGATERRLRRGLMAIEARLDLHGHTQAEAHAALDDFIRGSCEAGRRCVLVVTGRGDPAGGRGVLRRNLPGWLSAPALRSYVLAVAPAHARHGGEGASYVLLRRRERGR